MTIAPLTLDRLNIHQVTLNQCDFRESIECLSRHGVTQTGIWRETLKGMDTGEAKRILDDNGVDGTSFVAGGLFTHAQAAGAQRAIDLNKRWIDDAAEIGARSMVTITGGLPQGSLDLEAARAQALEGLAQLIPHARGAGVKLALEPLHPMLCGLRSVISTLQEGLEMLDHLDADDVMGLTFDSYALWWEADLEQKLRCAAPRILNVHVSDWLLHTRDVRLDRGMPGDGQIDNPRIRGWLEQAGFSGPIEVEIFSHNNWWKRPPDEVVQTVLQRMAAHL